MGSTDSSELVNTTVGLVSAWAWQRDLAETPAQSTLIQLETFWGVRIKEVIWYVGLLLWRIQIACHANTCRKASLTSEKGEVVTDGSFIIFLCFEPNVFLRLASNSTWFDHFRIYFTHLVRVSYFYAGLQGLGLLEHLIPLHNYYCLTGDRHKRRHRDRGTSRLTTRQKDRQTNKQTNRQ